MKSNPTHFLALRLKSPFFWDHVWLVSSHFVQVQRIQDALVRINSKYNRILVSKEKLHFTLGIISIQKEEDYVKLQYIDSI